MMAIVLIFIFVSICTVESEASRNRRIHITEGDPRDLTFYKAPSNNLRPGKPLPSTIIRSRQGNEDPQPIFLGTPKPDWNDDKEDEIFHQFTLVRFFIFVQTISSFWKSIFHFVFFLFYRNVIQVIKIPYFTWIPFLNQLSFL
jgi:hypothetical protein